MKHNYTEKLDVELLKGKIVMAFTDPLDTLMEDYDEERDGKDNYKYFTDSFTGYGVHTYYVFDTKELFISKWLEIHDKPNGMWYWCLDDGACFCSGACDPGDIEIFEDYFKNRGNEDIKEKFIGDLNLLLKDNFDYVPIYKVVNIVDRLVNNGWKFDYE